MPASPFGKAFFGQAVPLNQPAAPLGAQLQSPAQGAKIYSAPTAAGTKPIAFGKQGQMQAPAPRASFNQKRIPMGNKGDCPICH